MSQITHHAYEGTLLESENRKISPSFFTECISDFN